MGPTELHTERLLLRPFRVEDADDVAAYANDKEWSHFLWDVPQPYNHEHALQMIASMRRADWDFNPVFAVVLEERVIGRADAEIREHTQVAELGWSIAREHWGQGIAREAISALIDLLFTSYDLPRVFARADFGNERSWGLMERLGMQREAYLRGHRVGRDGRSDEVYYGLLREEWEANRA